MLSSSSHRSNMASIAFSCNLGKNLKNLVINCDASRFSACDPFTAAKINKKAPSCCQKQELGIITFIIGLHKMKINGLTSLPRDRIGAILI